MEGVISLFKIYRIILTILLLLVVIYNTGFINNFSEDTSGKDNSFIDSFNTETTDNQKINQNVVTIPKRNELTTADCFVDESYDPIDKICYREIVSDNLEDIKAEGDNLLELLIMEFGEFLNTENFWTNVILSMRPNISRGVNLITYKVGANALVKAEKKDTSSEYFLKLIYDNNKHMYIWGHFTYIIPLKYRIYIEEFVLFTDGNYHYLAFVEPYKYDITKWVIGVDIVDISNNKRLTNTLVHEYAHLLTLNETQVKPTLDITNNKDDVQSSNKEREEKDQYLTLIGESKPDSYINKFYNLFWSDIIDEWEKYAEKDNIEAFYYKYEDRFVSLYAASKVEEDIAESFVRFIFTKKPAVFDDVYIIDNTVAEKKILFFYEYPELIKKRSEILSRIYSAYRHTEQNYQ